MYGWFDAIKALWLREGMTETQQREQIIVERVDTVVHGNTVDIAARIRNPNPRVGIPEYEVTFTLKDPNGNELQSIVRKTYILPGSLNYIAAIDVPITGQLGEVSVNIPMNPNFVPLPEHISLPTFNRFAQQRQIKTIGQRQLEEVKGTVINTSTLGFHSVEITGVALDNEDHVVGIGTTVIENLRVGQQREFTLQWPVPSRAGERIVILPATNVYREGNILPIEGDPGLLR